MASATEELNFSFSSNVSIFSVSGPMWPVARCWRQPRAIGVGWAGWLVLSSALWFGPEATHVSGVFLFCL